MGFKKKKGRPKKEVVDQDEEDYEEEDFIDELMEKPTKKEEPSIEQEEDVDIDEALEEIEKRFKRNENAISVNQKYLKKMWEMIKELQDNFKLLYEAK